MKLVWFLFLLVLLSHLQTKTKTKIRNTTRNFYYLVMAKVSAKNLYQLTYVTRFHDSSQKEYIVYDK